MNQSDRNAIIDAAMKKTAEEFATEIAKRTVLSTKEVRALAKSKDERQALAKLLAIVTDAATDNSRKAAEINKATDLVEPLVKIARLFF